MTARVTYTQVGQILTTIELAAVNATSIGAAITVASLIVDEQIMGNGPSDSMLTQIELFLAAHFSVLSADRGPMAGNNIGDASEKYHNIYAAGLRATRFGQQAMFLDTTGALSAMADRVENPQRKSALFTVVSPVQNVSGVTDEEFWGY